MINNPFISFSNRIVQLFQTVSWINSLNLCVMKIANKYLEKNINFDTFSIKEKTVWLFRLYDKNYICHLFCVNDEDRLIFYNISRNEKQFIEDAFFILGPPGEAYSGTVCC